MVSAEYLRMVYFDLFQSYISQGLIHWWGHSLSVTDIFLVQKKVTRTLCKAKSLDHFFTLTFHTNISNVINLYHFHSLVYTKDHLNLFNTRKYSHNHNRRKNPSLIFLKHRLTYSGLSHLFNCITVFRKLKVVLISTLEDKRL